ncbi:unnamed protein product [Rotaria sp. Silwood2]|nr:unnamed protein product [Rotaria sp. Silwood2]
MTLCSRWYSNYRSLSSSSHESFHQYLWSNGTVFDENDLNICPACVRTFYNIKEATNISAIPESMDTTEEVDVDTDGQFTLRNIIFAGRSHKNCVICPQEIRGGSVEAVTAPLLDFLVPSLNDEDYLAWADWTKEQFDDMYHVTSSHLRSSSNHHIRNALAMFWIKLKTNLSFRQIGSMFNIPGNGEDRRKRAADAFDSVRQCLIKTFVSGHLGVQHLTREDAKKQNTSFSIEFCWK